MKMLNQIIENYVLPAELEQELCQKRTQFSLYFLGFICDLFTIQILYIFFEILEPMMSTIPGGIGLLQVNNKNTKAKGLTLNMLLPAGICSDFHFPCICNYCWWEFQSMNSKCISAFYASDLFPDSLKRGQCHEIG